ncbi:FtsK/SpoIIIE domain-containing protein [Goodfellowiella coeruleoviolacea]|uniref:FtsK/SpoIIIE family protein n=1 Tax=Goodfellowiella coeruleoviolacea TaxID=334858 RepID=A0AAE3KJ38_9PSEU|nr:FtsK/SpoIIIE domain-containing protein [Goodfellowiella coeruleoviolacea]MCP2169175.1 FtsK/SpoIIIE family protein [Goodfellowiella coeruleoviolacea]
MSRRDERRTRIKQAFAEFRVAVAAALGSAARQHHRVAVARAKDMFELMLRRAGIDAALRDPALAKALHNPVLTDRLGKALDDREEIFAEWTSAGPDQLISLVDQAAPGTASAPWESWLGQPGTADGSAAIPELWRIGTAVVDSAPKHQPFPVAVPLLDQAHLHVSSTVDSRALAETLVENLLLRVLSYFQPGLVHVHVWDTGQLTGSLPGLYPLTRAGLLTVHDPARLHELLDELSEHIRRIHTNMLVEGHTSLRAAAGAGTRRTEPWRIAVLFGNRSALKEELQQKLQRVARNGLACGIQLVIVDIPVTVNSPGETVLLADDQTARCTMTGRHATVTLDPALPRTRVPRACAAIAEALEERRSRLGTFADLLPGQLWTETSAAGVSTPVGYRDGEPVLLHLGDASPHALVGGPSGSGKTNFLYAMLAGLTARYGPDELELYLLDFKEGVSFAQFTPGRKDPSWLPHARLVGVNVNTDREFGVALLRFLAEEMRRRADAAKRHEVTKLEELRAEDPDGRWPRIVAVIDEFQFLFAERDAVTSQATALLEDVARRGRSQGIHLVLASQDVASIESFWLRPAIFEQFIVRVALPKSRKVLVEVHNDAAINLPRWHAVVNHESGVRQGNEIARIPDATSRGTFDELQHRLWRQRPAELTSPRLFDGSITPALDDMADFRALRPGPAVPVALLGQVIDVASSAVRVRMERAPGRNIAAIGSVVAEAAATIGGAVLSLAAQHEPGEARFTLACLVDAAHPWVDQVAKRLRSAGHEPQLVRLEDVKALLADLAGELTGRLTGERVSQPQPHYLALYGVDAAHAILEEKDPKTRRSGLDDLRTVLRHGPENRTHVLGWWRGVNRLKASMPIGSTDDLGPWVAFDVQGSELGSLVPGAPVNWSPRPHRGLFFDRFEHARPQVVIPFDFGDEVGGDGG